MSLFPITFSIPECKIIDYIPKKIKILSSLIPGDLSTYIYQNETDYYNEYRKSFFAKTTKKGGWDCMRHYEIIANGCIPYFPNIEICPINTMALLPKELIIQGNNLYEKYKNISIHELTKENINELHSLIIKFLKYMRDHLTTSKMSQYILEKSGFKNIKSILYLSGNTSPDYLRCVTLHGFKELFGTNCHDYPKIPHIYKNNNIEYYRLYGKGITYTNLFDENLHNPEFDDTVEHDIRNKKYDIIIYGSYHRGMPYYDLVSQIYESNQIILLCGEDQHRCDYNNWTNRGHNVFVREL